jgi:uncharacterized protein DUF1996
MFRTKLRINVVLIITILVTQVSIAFAAPASQRRPSVKQGVAQAGAPGWIVSCNYSHSLSDDPIVFPRLAGASHLHDFIGGRTTDAFSTRTSLMGAATTCAMPADASGYWVPALYENNVRVLPTATSKDALFYYRRKGAPSGTIVQSFPGGLKIIVGNAKATSPQENPQLGRDIIFKCGPGSGVDLPAPPTQCSSGVLVISLRFPNCWDGVNLDSTDHKSHMAYPVNSRCPKSHPVVLPRLESFFRYNVGTGPIGTIRLSSGPYYTAHQDFFNAWDPAVLQALVTRCLNGNTDCGTNPSVSGLRSAAAIPTNTLMATPTVTLMPTKVPTNMPTDAPMPTNRPQPMPTNTALPPTDLPTEVPTMVEPTQMAEPTQPMP